MVLRAGSGSRQVVFLLTQRVQEGALSLARVTFAPLRRRSPGHDAHTPASITPVTSLLGLIPALSSRSSKSDGGSTTPGAVASNTRPREVSRLASDNPKSRRTSPHTSGARRDTASVVWIWNVEFTPRSLTTRSRNSAAESGPPALSRACCTRPCSSSLLSPVSADSRTHIIRPRSWIPSTSAIAIPRRYGSRLSQYFTPSNTDAASVGLRSVVPPQRPVRSPPGCEGRTLHRPRWGDRPPAEPRFPRARVPGPRARPGSQGRACAPRRGVAGP